MSFEIKLGSYSFGNYVDTFEISQDSRVEQVAIPRRHGYMSDVGYKGGMSIRVGGLIYCDSYLDTRTAFNLLKNAFQLGKAVLTVFSDRQIEVQKTSFQSSFEDQDLRRIRWDAELVADDYGFEAIDQSVDEFTITEAGDLKLESDDSLLLESGDTALLESANSNTVVCAGNLDADAVIRITAGTSDIATGLRVNNITTGKFFIINQAITAGNWIEIDTDLLTVVDQAGANKLSSFSGDFFKLASGNNIISWNGTTVGSPKIKFTFNDKYDGI
jgi:hypothetical protein